MEIEQENQYVTVVISQLVKSGCEKDYEAWLREITGVAKTYSGHLGTNVIRPQAGVGSEYVIILRFDGYDNLKAWMTSRDGTKCPPSAIANIGSIKANIW